MRSIHKKPLKRLLSTLLALTMVLGMVPFTALAAPANGYNLTVDAPDQVAVNQVVDGSSTLTGLTGASGYTAYVTIAVTGPTGANPKILATDTTSGIEYNLAETGVWGDPTTGFAVAAGYSATTPLKLKFDVPGSYTATFKLINKADSTEICSGTKTITVVGFNSLTANPTAPQPGESFEVTASTTATSGVVQFSYGSQTRTAAVTSGGMATATFTAEAGQTAVVAVLSGISGVDAVTTSATLGTPATMHTITFDGNAVDAYHIPDPVSVAHNSTYDGSGPRPDRMGYTFAGWATTSDAAAPNVTDTTPLTVDGDKTLYAIWAEETVAITWPTGTITGATLDGPTPATAVKGSTVTFTITVTNGYDGSAMVVTANGSPLYGTKGTGNTYTYSFPATAATTIAVAVNPTLIPTYYNVKFVRGTEDATAVNWPADFTVEKGTLSVAIPNQIPTRDGYTFVNWAVGAGNVLPGHDITIAAPGVTDDLELRAVWEQDKVDVTYPADVAGVTDVSKNGTETVVKGSLQSFTVTLGTGYDPATLTVTANGVALAPVATGTAGQYQYSFVANATTAIAVSTPSLLQYTVTLPTGENFNALFTAPTPNVTSVTVNYNEGYTFKVAPVGNYTISEVYINGVAQGAGGTYSVASVTGPQTISIVMEAVTFYTVTYVVDGVQLTTRQVQKGSAIPYDVQAPAKDGYTFDGWYTASDFTGTKNSLGNATSDCEVYGRYNPTTATITFNDNGGSGGPVTQTKTYGVALNLSSTAPTWTGHTFLGWGTAADATVAVYQPGDMYSTEGAATLYAVWEDNTYTVTLPNGTGYSVSTTQSTTVKYNTNFTFTVVVDRAYAATAPEVKVNGTALPASTGSISNTSAATWTYTISGITEDKVVSISVTQNATYTVTFKYDMSDDNAAYEGKTFATQQVEHGYMPTQPVAPVIEGYTFSGWTPTDAFTTAVTGATEIKAVYTAITPKVTYPSGDTGWTLTDVVLSGTSTTVASNSTVAYKSSIDFKVTIATGYDATNLAVAANGLALSPVDVTGNVYTFRLANITEDQNITVVGVARKMITITYNDNGGIGGPGQEQVKYYLNPAPTGDPNSTISTVKPTRVGYEFQGWATTNDATAPAYSNPEKTSPATSKTANFTTDTTLYAVWSAKATTVTLTVDKTSQYEVENVVLTADVKSGTAAVTSGSVQFYRYTGDPNAAAYDVDSNWKLLDSKVLSGGKATLTIATSDYVRAGQNKDSYKAVFVPDEGAGYSTANSAGTKVTVNVLSTAISWKLNGEDIDTNGNVLTIKDSDGNTVTSMTAGQEYTLELPAIYALDEQTTKLTVNKDYTVTWQFCNASGTWEDYTAAAGTDSVKILAAYSKYVFRAVVTPLTGATGHFTQAAKYNGTALTADAYEAYLVTEATSPVAQQQTTTTLTVTDRNDIPVTGGTDIVAEFEGQKVTLTATVKLAGTDTKIGATGEVYFYKNYNPSTKTGTLIGKADVQSDGTATLEAEMSTYSYLLSDRFTAVYQDNATYKTSTSNEELVRIRSTAIAWTKNTSGAEVKTLTVAPTGSIYADNQYTLALPTIVEDGQPNVTLAVGTDYVVSWYMVKADKTVVLLAENTESNTYTVVPPTAGVTYYAVVSPKAGSNYTDAYEGGETKNFLTSAETAASVKAPTVTTITFGDVKTDTTKIPDFSQYEEKTITITAKVVEGQLAAPTTAKNPEELVKTGTVTFYVVTDTTGNYTKIGTATVSDGLATVSYTLPEFALNDGLNNIEYFFAVYSDTAGTYADSNTTENGTVGATVAHTNVNAETEAVQILSTSISWKLDTSNTIVASPDANKLKVYTADDNGNKGTEVTDGKMTAGSSYVLELPAVYALDDAQTAATALTVNKDYTVVWQYREFGTSDWNNYPNASAGNTVLITPDYSGYQFQAVVTPVYDNAALTGYKTAAQYDANDVATGKTASLVTDPTEKTELQATTTALEITGADNEDADVKINGATPFSAAHLAQFEGQTVILEATVKETTTGTPAVTTGYVNFYRYVATGDDELLNTTPVAVGANGVATFEVTISDYSTASGQTVLTNVDRFYAVYLVNDTYDTSASVTKTGTVYDQPGNEDSVYIKSTAIKTPVITSAKAGTGNATSTTYTTDLDNLLAGVEHKFTLRTTGAAGVAGQSSDWSVVALDGRTVPADNYTIQWLVTTGTNEEKAANNETAATFVVNESKSGDKYRVKLVPTADGDMKTGATSNYVVIGTKQDVTVTVTASDKIDSTTDTDAYQLDEVTLTATVAAAQGANATVKPSGTVAFYYENNGSWVKLGEAVLNVDTDGQMRASITTTELPVTDITNIKRDVKISVTYTGDKTFNEITNQTDTKITPKTVTVYSSVVYVNSGVENVASNTVGQNHNSGIYIYAEEGKVLANETNVNLKLSDVYTLDHDISLSKLAYGVDYTVQWQKLSNAASYASDYADEEVPWQPITSANGTICQIAVEDGAAYRAVITVTDTPIAKGSYTEVNQDIDGRRVYYSNILVASDAPATVTVNVNTSNVADGYEGIVEGETVTIHTFTSGATGTTPISELTMTLTNASGAEVDKQVKTNVNGHVSFDWAAAAPGYYTMTLTAKFTNGYSDKTIVRELIVRDNDYSFTTSGDGVAYNGKAQFLKVAVGDMGIESELAQKSVVVYYYDKDGKQVEPTQAGTYTAKIRLQESAYWTEKTLNTTFTIAKRQLSIEDVIVQAKVYDGTTTANVQEIILKDAVTNQTTGLPLTTDNTGVINGDSVFVTGTAVTNSADVKYATTVTVTAGELQGDDAANYELQVKTFTESFKIQRSQVQGDIADATYKYGTTKVPAEDIYLIDQAGTVLGAEDYTVTYYYHSGNGVKQVSAMNWKGMYTVIARPDQDNYKGGASQTVYVADAAVDADPVKTAKSALISITNTVELFGDANNQGIQATATKGTAVVKYNVGGAWVDTAPTAAGRYLVKVTAEENSAVIGTAYGLYTVVKTYPDYSIEAADADYNSAQYAASNITTNAPAGTYFTYTGGTIQGVAYEAPTEVGTYVVTAHIPESDNTVAHEFSDTFEIKPIALKITADSLQRRQYGAFPDMTASFDGLATGGVAADTSLRDVQIQPELIFNAAYSNDAMDQVGSYTITPVAALARNYKVSYETGLMTVTADEPNPYLAIHGMIENGNGAEDLAYYGDEIQLYAYGSQSETGVINNSSVLTWSVTNPSICGTASISQDGLLEVNGVGTFTVTLTRGVGAQKISTSITITALKQEVKVVVPELNTVYNATSQDYTTTNTMIAVNAKGKQVFTGNDRFVINGNTRTDVGSQIVTGKVVEGVYTFQSETYGGLFTINDKEATVAPVGKSVQYSKDLGTLTHTEKDSNGNLITDALSNEQIASIRSDYINLDAGTYEILVAGTEDMNYNVKYTTNPNAEVVTVTALENTLKYTTGVIAGSTGRTNGYLQAADKFYPDEGAVVTYADPTVEPNDRMYGEPNPAMNYLFTGLLNNPTKDSLADLVELIELVGFVPGIDKEANVAFTDAHISASGVATGKSGTYLSGKSYYETTTALPVDGVKNYLMENTDITLGIQNVYQRPFTLKLTGNKTDLRVYKPLVINGSTVNKAKLLEIILDNMEVVEYESGGKKYGGLATKLGHTINDVNLEIVSATYNSVAGTINVELKCNDNYWLSNKNWTIVVDPSMITVSYGTLGKYSSSVTMYGIDEDGNNIGATDVTGKVWYEIYVEDTSLQRKYSNYKDLTPVVRVQMTKGNGTGVYVANYNSTPLSAGHYVMFAIAEDYTIIE